MQSFKSESLPYDMGNAGDLIKHGLLAEYAQWWSENNESMLFLDPFGGRPWQEPVNPEVSKRILKLTSMALSIAQEKPKSRYFGSGFVIRNILEKNQYQAEIMVSDRDSNALDDLLSVGFKQFESDGFDKNNAFSILDCKDLKQNTSLILLDPFAEFINEAEISYPKIASFIKETNIPIALYLLSDNESSIKYSQLRNQYFDNQLTQLSIACPTIANSQVKGESKFSSEISLLLPNHLYKNTLHILQQRLTAFSEKLSLALEVPVIFSRRN